MCAHKAHGAQIFRHPGAVMASVELRPWGYEPMAPQKWVDPFQMAKARFWGAGIAGQGGWCRRCLKEGSKPRNPDQA